MVCIEEAKAELRAKARPELKVYLDDISDYDNIFVVGPNWWGIYPMALYNQLERLDFTGKTCTMSLPTRAQVWAVFPRR